MTLQDIIEMLNLDEPVVQAVIGFALILLGLGLLIWRTYNLLRATESTLWATTEGFIAQKYIKEEIRIVYDEDTGRNEERKIRYPYLVFSYNAQGNAYDSDKIVMGSAGRISRGIYNRYAKGQKVTVYYDPNDPQISHIEKPSTIMLVLGAALGGVMTVSGIILLVFGISGAR